MANESLNQFSSFVNQQMLSVEDVNEHLAKASALMEVALHYDFADFPANTIYHYLWVLNDIIHDAYNCSTRSLNEIFEANRVVNDMSRCYSMQEEKA